MSLQSGQSESVERLLRSLGEQAQEVDESLQHFTSERAGVLAHQKRALAEYDAEMLLLEQEELGEIPDEEVQTPYMDPNIMRHLNVDKESDYVKNLTRLLMPSPSNKDATRISVSDFPIVDKKQEQPDKPAPGFNEKKKLRETMFLVLEESAIEETRLELAYEEAKESGDLRKASELADALYFVQRMNSDRLNDLITEYKPEPFGKAWGADPEYMALSRQIHAMTESFASSELSETSSVVKKKSKGHASQRK